MGSGALKCFWTVVLSLTAGMLFAIEGKMFCSLADDLQDQFSVYPPTRPPHLSACSKVVKGQPVMIRVILSKPAIRDGIADVLMDLSMRRPDGTFKNLAQDLPAIRGKCSGQGVFLSMAGATMVPEEQDPFGVYEIIAILKDRNNGTAHQTSAKLELMDAEPAEGGVMNDRELGQYLITYYNDPHPEKLLAAIRGFLELEPTLKRKKSFRPEPTLMSFSLILRQNPQLIPAAVAFTKSLQDDQAKQYMALIFNSCGAGIVEKARKDLDPATKLFLDKLAQMSDPLAMPGKVCVSGDLDMLWHAFFITGRAEPLRRMIPVLEPGEEMTISECKAKGPNPSLTKEEKVKLNRHVIRLAAEWSLKSNANNHPQVCFYLEGMLLRKQVEGEKAAETLAKIVASSKFNKKPEKKSGSDGASARK